MKRLLAFVCIVAMLLMCCACKGTETETTVLSYFEGDDAPASDDGTQKAGDQTDSDSQNKNDDSEKSGDKGNSSDGTGEGSVNSSNADAVNNDGTNADNGNTGTQNGDSDNGGSKSGTDNSGTKNGSGNSGSKNGSDVGSKSGSDNNSSKDSKTNSGTKNTGTNSNITNPLSVDLKGATITIYDVQSVFNPDASNSKTDSAKADLIAKLQSELNCKFDVKTTDVNKLMSLAAASAASGKAISQIMTVNMHKMGYFIGSNLVADMGKISSMDLSKDYMNAAGMLEASRFGSGRYAVASDGTNGSCILFNKRILKELGYAENYIYDLVDSGKWTYTEFRRLAKEATKDLDGKPGMSSEDQWGMAVMDMETGATADLLVSAETPMLKLVDGKLTSNMSNANIAKIANLLADTYKKDGTRLDVTGKKAHEAFRSGKVFMEYTVTSILPEMVSMRDEFGFVPTPKYNESSKYSSAFDWNYSGLMIPAGLSAEQQYNAGAVVQAYMYLMQDIYGIKKSEYNNRYFCDTKSGDYLVTVMNGVTTHPVQCYAHVNETILTGTYRVFWNYISKNASVASAVESTGSALKKTLEDLNKKIKDK